MRNSLAGILLIALCLIPADSRSLTLLGPDCPITEFNVNNACPPAHPVFGELGEGCFEVELAFGDNYVVDLAEAVIASENGLCVQLFIYGADEPFFLSVAVPDSFQVLEGILEERDSENNTRVFGKCLQAAKGIDPWALVLVIAADSEDTLSTESHDLSFSVRSVYPAGVVEAPCNY